MNSKITRLAAAMMAVGLFAGSAMAYTSNLTGTYNAQDNQTPLTIVISQAPTTGACAALSGTIGTDDLEGFYCPMAGRFNFIRIHSGQTIQEYSGNASTTGSTEYISGIFGAVTAGGGTLGEYSFFAWK
jgi:hypothetical protein